MGIYNVSFNIGVRAYSEEDAFYKTLDYLESNSPDDWLKIEEIDTDVENSTSMKNDELIRCEHCKHLDVINSNEIYAKCKMHGIEFLPFEDDTIECFCSWAERKEE